MDKLLIIIGKIASFSKTVIHFVANLLLSFLAWSTAITSYLPFIFLVYVLNFGIDYKKLPNLKGFVKLFKFVVKSFFFPTENGIRKIGYIVVLPFLKAEKEEENPISSMYSKYLNAEIAGKDLTINHEYIDSIHRKHNYFILFTFFGASLVYLSIALAAEEVAALLGTVGSWASALVGMEFLGFGSGANMRGGFGNISALSMATMVFFKWSAWFLEIYSYIFYLVGGMVAFWGFRELRTQNNIQSFVRESAKLLHLSLCENFKNDDQMLIKLENSLNATIESVKLPRELNEEFVHLNNNLLLEKEIIRLTNEQQTSKQ